MLRLVSRQKFHPDSTFLSKNFTSWTCTLSTQPPTKLIYLISQTHLFRRHIPRPSGKDALSAKIIGHMLQAVSIPYMNKLNIMRRKEKEKHRLTQISRVRTLDRLLASAFFLTITIITMINTIMTTTAIAIAADKIPELGESSSGSPALTPGFCEASAWG